MGKGLVLGFFDGVHIGHRAVIESALEYTDDVTLVTLKDSPAVYFNNKTEYILSRKNSIDKIKRLGVKEIIELDFSQVVSMTAGKYLQYLADTFNPIIISTGFNHTFGAKKVGNTTFLRENQTKYGYKYICVSPIEENGKVVSSTLIKDYIRNGKVECANFLLGSRFILEGIVVHGAKIGRTIGFPTANINYPKDIVKLPFGVYCALIDGKKTVMNWGLKPTVNNTQEPVVEAHILDFDGDLYGQEIKIEVLKQIRGEKKFANLNELKTQISEDVKQCLEL